MFGQETPLLLDALKYPGEQEAMTRSLSVFLLDLWKQASSQSQPVKYQRGVTKSAIYEKPLTGYFSTVWYSSSSPSNLMPVYRAWLPEALLLYNVGTGVEHAVGKHAWK